LRLLACAFSVEMSEWHLGLVGLVGLFLMWLFSNNESVESNGKFFGLSLGLFAIGGIGHFALLLFCHA
jgi:hypothetical protein